jgi:hypothetical protein
MAKTEGHDHLGEVPTRKAEIATTYSKMAKVERLDLRSWDGHLGVCPHVERWRVKTQGSLPSEDAALVLLFRLVASGQVRLRRIDGWQNIKAVLRPYGGGRMIPNCGK